MEQGTYKIGEAANLLNLKTYVLRFWETEFSQIAPLRTEKGQRLYTEQDITLLKRIRFLLHDRGLTIEGAKRILEEEISRGHGFTDSSLLELADEDEGFSVSIVSSLDEERDVTSVNHTTASTATLQKTLYYNENGTSVNEPLFQPNNNSLYSINTPLQQAEEVKQTINQRVLEESLQTYVLNELEDIARILRSRTNAGDHS